MLEITRKNCYKCDLEIVFDNNSQYFWIKLKDFEVEAESKLLNIFNKHGNKSTLKYRRELTPSIKFQADRIFLRNDLFEQVIKSCKATNVEFTMLKEKLGICLYEENYYEEEIIKIQDEEPIEEISKVSNKKSTKKLIEESDNESNKESDNESIEEIGKISNKKSTKKLTKELIKESDNEPIKKIGKVSNKKSFEEMLEEIDKKREEEFIKDLREEFGLNNKSTTNWYDKNKFNKILTTIVSNNFNQKNKISKFKFNDINDLIHYIRNNTTSEANAKKKINKLNEIKNVQTNDLLIVKSYC